MTDRLLNQVKAFNYVTVPSAPTFRAVMQVFYEAKQRYVVEMRAGQVRSEIDCMGVHVELSAEDGLDYHLERLVEWGNISRRHDTASVTRIEDFYRKRYVYRLTAVGEAAHRAVLEVEATVGRSGSLQSSMLHKIRDALDALASSVAGPEPEGGQLVRLLHDLFSAFDTLTIEANRYIGDLSRNLSPERLDEERFKMYKAAVLAYVSRFVEQLRRLTAEISSGLRAVRALGVEGLLDAAARSADLPPPMEDEDPVARWTAEQHARWQGVCAWFLPGAGNEEPTVELLAGVARQAVVGLTRSLSRLDDRRSQRADRAADFRLLARWFSGCADQRQAHRLFEAAFGLYPARHFHLAEEDTEQTAPWTSWWEAAPVEVPVRLRTRGSVSEAGRPSPAADFSGDRRWIAQLRRQQKRKLQAALARFVGRGPQRVSELVRLEEGELEILLDLLDEVLAGPPDSHGVRAERTADGRLEVRLCAPPGDKDRAEVDTPSGLLSCADYTITVQRRLAQGLGTGGAEEDVG